jgi:hypothetical protein
LGVESIGQHTKTQKKNTHAKKNLDKGTENFMIEINLNEGQWEDRKQWSLGVGQRRKTV